jgi:hypothetical protein
VLEAGGLLVDAHGGVQDVGEVALSTRRASGLVLPAAIRRSSALGLVDGRAVG